MSLGLDTGELTSQCHLKDDVEAISKVALD